MDIKPELIERLKKLEEKYQAMGQDLLSYLDGLLYADYLTYWDYIHLDTLLSLQNPKTNLPDENIFIIYHQVTELYFKLILLEIRQIANNEKLDADFFSERLKRINRYWDNLIHSFDIMVDGMEKEQFLKFRMTLLPGSGFQTAQYRMIEFASTDFINLVAHDSRNKLSENTVIEKMYEHLYWREGATELATGKKTLTLRRFEKKYSKIFIEFAKEYQNKNLWAKYKSLSQKEQKNGNLISALRQMDANVCVNWPLVHYKSAVRYLDRKPEIISATGGTNWQKYLPPKFQKRILYPEFWSDEEKENWGKQFFAALKS